MDSLSEMQSQPCPKIGLPAFSASAVTHMLIVYFFIFSPQGIVFLFVLFQSQFRPDRSHRRPLFSTRNRQSFPTFLGHSSFISVRGSEGFTWARQRCKAAVLTLETSLLCNRRFLYSVINLHWQLQLTRWNIKRDKWSRLKNTHQLLGKVILVAYSCWHHTDF